MTTHQPEQWYWEAGSEECPHGPRPGDTATDEEYEAWNARHGHSDNGPICLDAPSALVCGACSANEGDAVDWTVCRARPHAQERPNAPKPTGKHEPVIVFVGLYDHLERDCDELYTDDGDEITSNAHCSHVTEQVICGGCSVRDSAGYYEPAIPWTGPHAAPESVADDARRAA